MIAEKCHQENWIQEKRIEFGKADPLLIEKVIKAFTLLDTLVQQDLTFTFKGGTALLLLLPQPLRFSIDVDVIIEQRPVNLNIIPGCYI
jgi:predicted nucleotidyltransferase component of viral defense system